MGPTWGPPGSDRTQMGTVLAPWTLLSGDAEERIPSIHVYQDTHKVCTIGEKQDWRILRLRRHVIHVCVVYELRTGYLTLSRTLNDFSIVGDHDTYLV